MRRRESELIFEGSIAISQMKRKPEELAGYIFRACSFPFGCLIMTGTGVVPASDFSLQSGDQISITIDGIGTLVNTIIQTAKVQNS